MVLMGTSIDLQGTFYGFYPLKKSLARADGSGPEK